MKKILALLLTTTIAVGSLSGCIRTDYQKDKVKFLASFYPIYIMALNIIDSSTGINLLADGHHHDEDEDEHEHEHEHEEEHNHDHGEYNAHLWVSVANYIKQVENITEGIVKIDPVHEKEYRRNSKEYIAKLTKLQNEMESGLANISDRNIITFHEAFDYFAEEFNLNIVSVIEPGSEPNAKDLASIIDLTNETGVKALFVEPQYPDTSADIIAAETDAKVYTLDPGVSGDMNKDAYIIMMQENLKVLQKALT